MNHTTSSILLIACLLMAVHTLTAQDEPADTTSVLREAVLVTASRAGADDPVTQATIDSTTLRRVVVGQDMQYVLERTTPSVVAYSESGTNFSNYGSFRLRGMDQTRVNVTLNGAPLNDMIDQGVFFSNITDLSNGLSSIQVQRGVGTSQNGTASYAGSVNIESPRLSSATPGGRLQLTGGSFGLLRASAEVFSGVIDGGYSIHAKVTTFNTDGYRHNTGTRSFSGSISGAWYGTSDIIKLSAVGGRTANELGYFAVPKPLTEEDPRTNINDSTDHDDFGQHLVQLEWDHQLGAYSVLSLMAYYGGAGGDFLSGWRDEEGTLTQINYPLKNDHLGLIGRIGVQEMVPELDLEVGFHVYRFWRRNWEAVAPELKAPYYDDRTVKDEASAFVKASWNSGAWGLFADIQARAVNMTFTPDERWVRSAVVIPRHDWFFLNPRAGVSFDLSTTTMLYSSIGHTGREPTRFDLLGSTQINEANLDVLINPGTVRPEYVTDIELGYRITKENWTVDLNGFYMIFTDEIAPIGQFIEQQFVQLRKNVAASQRYGIEMQASRTFSEHVSIHVFGTWMKSNIDSFDPENDGQDVVYENVSAVLTPEIMASATVIYSPIAVLDFSATARYQGESFLELTNNPVLVLEPFGLIDLSASWNVYGPHRIRLDVYNILDVSYATNGATAAFEGVTVATLFKQATRSFIVQYELEL